MVDWIHGNHPCPQKLGKRMKLIQEVLTIDVVEGFQIDEALLMRSLKKKLDANTVIEHANWCEWVQGPFDKWDNPLTKRTVVFVPVNSTDNPFSHRGHVRLFGTGRFKGQEGSWYMTGADRCEFERDKRRRE